MFYFCKQPILESLFTMVNTEEFTQRLHKIMQYHELSAASFADKIEVGRSSISHLLSGRNKPSLDFVMKIVNAFPDVELYWLLNGKGTFPKSKDPLPHSLPPKQEQVKVSQEDLFSALPGNPEGSVKQKSSRAIQKIVIFYTDGTFEAFQN